MALFGQHLPRTCILTGNNDKDAAGAAQALGLLRPIAPPELLLVPGTLIDEILQRLRQIIDMDAWRQIGGAGQALGILAPLAQ